MHVSARRKLLSTILAPLTVLSVIGAVAFVAPSEARSVANFPAPEQYFGFEMGAAGKLAGYDRVTGYFDLVAERSGRVDSHYVGPTTMGNDYTYLTISSRRNLARLDRIVKAHERLSNPAGLTEEEAKQLARRTPPIYYMEATIHSTEVGNGQAVVDVVHRLATERSAFTRNVLKNSVVVLVPSQNPDGQHLVIDYFQETAGTGYERVYPDLYHKYTGHDDNRDWFMFTQKETRYRVNLMQRFHPVAGHFMHQRGNEGVRIFVPPYSGVKSPDVPPNAAQAANAMGQEAARNLTGAGKAGVGTLDYPIWWTADVTGWHTYQGTALYLSEIASATDLAYPQRSKDGEPLGPQLPTMSNPRPYDADTWTLKQIVDYAKIAAYSGLEYVANNGPSLLYNNVYGVARKAASGTWTDTYAYVIPAKQRDHYGTYELLRKLDFGDVVIHRATEPFTAGGKGYRAGSYVVEMAQPLGRFAHQVLKTKKYPDYRKCGDCPVSLPYSDAGPSLPLFLGVDVDEVGQPFGASLRRVEGVTPRQTPFPPAPGEAGAYLLRPGSYGVFRALDALQDADVPTFRAARRFKSGGRALDPGTLVVPPNDRSRAVLEKVSRKTGLRVFAAGEAPRLKGFQLKPGTRIGLYRGVGNMQGGWMMWLFDRYDINYELLGARDFERDRGLSYDVLVFPDGISKRDLVEGLNPDDYPERFSWAYGIGREGVARLREFVNDGGTLLALGSSSETARRLLDLPIAPVVSDENHEFRVPGSFLLHRYDRTHPVAWGMPARWPAWFAGGDQAYQVTDGKRADAVSRYPDGRDLLVSGYATGEDILHGNANVVAHRVGDGEVVTYGTQIAYRTWPRVMLPLLFNAIYQGPAEKLSPNQFEQLRSEFTTTPAGNGQR